MFSFEVPTSLIIQIIPKNFQFYLDPLNEFRWAKEIINHWYLQVSTHHLDLTFCQALEL